MRYLLLIMTIIFTFCPTTEAQVAQEWIALYNGPAGGIDLAFSIAVDDLGNTYVTGYSAGITSSSDYTTIKYNPAGEQLWVAYYNGPGNNQDEAKKVALDAAGNVYISGNSKGNGTNWDCATVKYDPAGNQLWVARYNGLGNGVDLFRDLAVDSEGNVYIAGRSERINGTPTSCDYLTIKYNTAGVQLWAVFYNGPGSGHDDAQAIALDEQGNAYVTGKSDRVALGLDYEFATVKYNSEGIVQWVAHYNGFDNDYDEGEAVGVDDEGNVYVTGGSGGPTGQDYATIKYSSAGVQQWAARYDGPLNSQDIAWDLALDQENNVMVTGESRGDPLEPPYPSDFCTIKYTSEGVQQWVARFDGIGNAADYAHDLLVDDEGNIYVAGNSANSFVSGGDNLDFTTVKYNPAGITQWVTRYNGPDKHGDYLRALALDSNRNVYVTGYIMYVGMSSANDWATLKYHQDGSPAIILALIPAVSPIQIPPEGGSFDFDLYVTNPDSVIRETDLWADLKLPDGSIQFSLLSPVNLALDPGTARWRRHQYVPGNAPAGEYCYFLYAGEYPNIMTAMDTLTFTKLGSGSQESGRKALTRFGGWINTGEDFDFGGTRFVASHQGDMMKHVPPSISPNPFNPSTAISYELRAASYVSLKVYDTAGRLVSTLVNGYREAGAHEVTFDGSSLPSGVYLYRLEAGEVSAGGKMVLLK